ncbi:hypothetical protein ACEPAG_2905 [Sanghuangporus baumii]
MRNIPHELYAWQLQCLNYGYALFEPNPNGAYDFVRVGDVGYVSEDGKFMKLFNAFSDPGSPENLAARLPDNFQPIDSTFRETDRLEPLPPGCRRSQNVRTLGGSLSMAGGRPVPQCVAGGSLTLSCSNGAGAALITKYSATRQKALASRAMENYMISHVLSWFQLVQNLGRPVEMHDLVFVRECVLTGDWANISWNSSSCDSDVSFSVGLPGAANIGVSFWGQWQQHTDVPKLEGPFRDTPIANEETPVFDQCIFIKGLRIAERAWYDKLACLLKLPLGKGKEEKNELRTSSGLRIIGDKDFKITAIGEVGSSIRSIQNAYDAVAMYLFEKSSARFALIDDNDIFSLSMYEADSLEGIYRVLLELYEKGPSIDVIEGKDGASGTAYLFCSRSAEGSDLVLLDEGMNMLDLEDEQPLQSARPAGTPMRYAPSKVTDKGKTSEDSYKSSQQSQEQSPWSSIPYPPLPIIRPSPSGSSTLKYNPNATILDVLLDRGFMSRTEQSRPRGRSKWNWTYAVQINGIEYGLFTENDFDGNLSADIHPELMRLSEEEPGIVTQSVPYRPAFNMYLNKYNLTERIQWTFNKSKNQWRCNILRDGSSIACGDGRTKEKAAEEAAINATLRWSY